MSWVPAEKVIDAIRWQRQNIAEQEQRIAGFAQYHATEKQKLEAEQRQAVAELGAAILPRLDHPSIAAAAQTTLLVGLVQENIPARVEARRAWLIGRTREIERNPHFAQRELLRHPRTGSLVTAMNDAMQNRAPLADIVGTCESFMRFGRLMETGYGTQQESGSWWRYSYWEDRAAAKEILKSFPKLQTFAQVRAEYARAKEGVAVFDAEIARFQGLIAAGQALEREYAAHATELRNLDAQALEHTRNRIVQHLLGTDASVVAQRLRTIGSPLLLVFLRASGLQAKITYLEGIQRQNIQELQQELYAQKQKLDAQEQKTRRRWAPMPLDRYQKLTEDRRPRFEKRWQRFGKIYKTVYVYDRWDRGQWYWENLLWWDIMTRGRYDGTYIPEVATWHRAHPGYQFDPDWKGIAERSDDDDIGAVVTSDSNDDADAAAASIDADASEAEDSISTTDAS